MPKLRSVAFWPESGHRDQSWDNDGAPAADAWARTSRRVCERYSERLREADIDNRVGTVRFTTRSTRGEALLINPSPEPLGGWEGGLVQVPEAVATLPPQQRARLVLDAIDFAMRHLAQARGWPPAVLDECRNHVEHAGYGFSWASDTKTDRSRRHQARLLIDLHDDGFGRCVVELSDAGTGKPIGYSDPLLAFSTVEGFQRSFKSLHWNDDSTLTLVHFSDPFGAFNQSTTLDPSSDFHLGPAVPPPDPSPESSVSQIKSVSQIEIVMPVPTARILGGGGGPMNHVPNDYRRTVGDFFGSQVKPDLIDWWRQTGLIELSVQFDYSPGRRSGIRLYQRGQNLQARVRRPTPDPTLNDNATATAREDLRAVFEAVRKRFQLPSPPLPRSLT